ncbi:hypothetical protein [Methylocella silvestris]|uniref:Uncharacterized protein n=1 Tax=Methylocella silvestris TaxID=199596 RepID=A0A2J7TCS8_METSI|nr:hypothetical protein [Methylocella silvestris]PNG24562.1 hypothetical protein CR492_18085 [Methylocella silvestris]
MTDRRGQAINVIDLIDESGFSHFQRIPLALRICIAALDGIDPAAIGFIAPRALKALPRQPLTNE